MVNILDLPLARHLSGAQNGQKLALCELTTAAPAPASRSAKRGIFNNLVVENLIK